MDGVRVGARFGEADLRRNQRRAWERFLGLCGVAILLAAASLVRLGGVAPVPVFAAYGGCDQYPHCFSVLLDSDPQNISGIWTQTNNASITAGNSIHTNNTIWMHVNNESSDLIEMGQSNEPAHGYPVYFYYAAVNGVIKWSAYANADSSTHTLSMMSLQSNPNIWSFYLDGVSVYSDDFRQSYGYAYKSSTGGEIYLSYPNTLNSSIYTSTFNNYVQELDSSGGYYHPWNNYSYHIDSPCGVTGWTNCLNANIPSWSVWSWNKAQ